MVPVVSRSTPTLTEPALPPSAPEPPMLALTATVELAEPETAKPPEPPPPPRLCANKPCASTPAVEILLLLSTVTSLAPPPPAPVPPSENAPLGLAIDNEPAMAKPPLPPPPPTLCARMPYERSPDVCRFAP